jgi:hypothetical protein
MSGNVVIIQHAMNGGEVSARMEAREDQNKYLASLATCVNWIPLTLGGVTRRPGFYFAKKAKFSGDSSKPEVRVLPFVFSGTQAYQLEVGHLYFRIYKGTDQLEDPLNPGNPLELITPYPSGNLSFLQPYQSADVEYFPSSFYPIQKLSRVAIDPDDFAFTQVNFNPPATQEDAPTGDVSGAGTLSLAAITGTGVNFTVSNSYFLTGDVGRIITSGGGRGLITAVTSPTVAVVFIIDPFLTTGPIPATDWKIEGPYTSKISSTFGATNKSTNLVADTPTFRANDVGKFIVIYDGTIRIDLVTDSTHAQGTNLNEVFNDANPAPPATPAWTMEVNAWSGTFGFPSCGCFGQDRMWLFRDQLISGSVVGDYENFAKGATDDSAISRTISDDRISPILWAKWLRNSLLIGTESGIYEARASTDGKPLTPNDFVVTQVSSRGAARINPVRLGGQILYVQSGQKKMRELTFDILTNKYKSPNLLLLSEHLTEGFILTDATFQQEPDSIVWVVRNDGMLLSLVYQEEEQVVGWGTHITKGRIRSVSSIPRYDRGKDWLWAVVDRDIVGMTETYIEFMEPDLSKDQRGPAREWHELETDSAIVTTPNPDFTIGGLQHLQAETVRVIGDGVLFADQVVSTAGIISLEPPLPVTSVEVGLDYESKAITLEPVLPAQAGGPFLCRGYADVGVRIRRTLGLTLNGEEMVYRRPEYPMDNQVPLQRGKKCIMNEGYDAFGRIEVKQSVPFPSEVLGIIGKLHISDRWLCETYGEMITEIAPPPAPGPPSEECIPFPLPQTFTQVDQLDLHKQFDPGEADGISSVGIRVSWGYVTADPDRSVTALRTIPTFSGFGLPHYDDPLYTRVLNAKHASTVEIPKIPAGFSFTPDDGMVPVHSDGPSYAVYMNTGIEYFDVNDNTATFFTKPASYFPFKVESAAKLGSRFVVCVNRGTFGGDHIGYLVEFVYSSAMFVRDSNVLISFARTTALQYTANFLYALCEDAVTGNYRLIVLNRSDLSIANNINLNLTHVPSMDVVSDTLIYFIQQTGPGVVSFYFYNAGTVSFLGSSTMTAGITPPPGLGAYDQRYMLRYRAPYLYYGSNAYNGTQPDVAVFGPVTCH